MCRSKRTNSRKIYENDIVYFPQEIIDNLKCCLSLSEMELDCDLGDDEWKVLENVKLSKREKQCLYMYFWEGMTQAKIANNLEITRNAITIYLKRAKIKIRKYYME